MASIQTLGSFSIFLPALILAGVLQCVFGLLRAGRFISLVPGNVIKGMLAAIGLLLIMQQIPVALGAAGDAELVSLINDAFRFSLSAMLVAGIGLLILWLWTTPAVKPVKTLGWRPGPAGGGAAWQRYLAIFCCRCWVKACRAFTLPAFDSMSALVTEP